MKKPFKLSKFLLIPLAGFFALTTNNLAFAASGSSSIKAYIDFTIGEGLSTDGEGMNGVLISIYDEQYPIGTSSSWNPRFSCAVSSTYNTCNKPTFLYYVSAPGYQNAQCLVDGVPKAANEQFTFSNLAESPTQIVCTAEPIPDPGSATTTFNVNLPEVIEISNLPASVELDISPSAAGVFKSVPINITLGTNYKNGYSLFMNADSTDLVGPTTDIALPTLPTTTMDYTLDSFTINHWGYSTDDTIFHPLLTTQLLDSTSAPTSGKISTINLGVKANLSLPYGTYTGHFIFVAIPNVFTE